MKKALALIMAIAMIASMAVVSMAATKIDPALTGTKAAVKHDSQLFTYSKAGGFKNVTNGTVQFGQTVYVNLFASDCTTLIKDADAVKGLNVSAKWEQNGNYVDGVEIVKVGATGDSRYMIAIATTGSSLETVTVLGNVAVKGKSYYEVVVDEGLATEKLVGQKADVKFDFDVEIELTYGDGTEADKITLEDGKKEVYNFETYDPQTADNTIEVVFGELSAVVSPKGMKKVLLAYNDNVNEALYDEYIDADLTFINCTAAFRRSAEVTVNLLDTEYFYEVVDGQLVEVEGEYDEWTEEFTFKTRTLGNYVISDTELVVGEVAVANPSTGAAA